MKSKLIARVYLCGQGSLKVVDTTPGRALRFIGGVAPVTDARDMPFALRLDGVQVEIEPEYAESLHDWVRQIPLGQHSRAKVVVLGAPPMPKPEKMRVPETPSEKRGPGRPRAQTLWEPQAS